MNLLRAQLRWAAEGRLQQRAALPRRHPVREIEATTEDVAGLTMEDLLVVVHPGMTEVQADPDPEADEDRIVARIWCPDELSEVMDI